MEDQQPDSGDLTTGDTDTVAGDTDQAPTETSRKPVRKAARAPKVETVQSVSLGEPADNDGVEAGDARAAEAEVEAVEAGDARAAEVEDSEVEDAPAAEVEDSEVEDAPAAEVEDSEVEDAPAEAVTMVAHRPAGKRLLIAAAAASVLFVGAGAFAGAMVQPYLAENALVDTKLDIAQTAADAITTLWTYTPDDMNTLAERASRYLAGDFAEEYRRYIDAIVEPNKQAQVTNTTEVMGAAVETVAPTGTPDEATAIVYTNSVATSPVTKNIPSLRYLSYRLTMERDGAQWLITRMSTVTSFDLTPQL